MIHTVYLDDEYSNVKKILTDISRQKEGVGFDKPATDGVVPEGYMTSEEFWKEADKRIVKVCKQYGVL